MSFPKRYDFELPKIGEIKYTFTRRDQLWVGQKVYNAIHWINLYPVDSTTGFLIHIPIQDNDLSGGITLAAVQVLSKV